ncbi:unnamed protein product, partial [Protopolystoma xenopodis]
ATASGAIYIDGIEGDREAGIESPRYLNQEIITEELIGLSHGTRETLSSTQSNRQLLGSSSEASPGATSSGIGQSRLRFIRCSDSTRGDSHTPELKHRQHSTHNRRHQHGPRSGEGSGDHGLRALSSGEEETACIKSSPEAPSTSYRGSQGRCRSSAGCPESSASTSGANTTISPSANATSSHHQRLRRSARQFKRLAEQRRAAREREAARERADALEAQRRRLAVRRSARFRRRLSDDDVIPTIRQHESFRDAQSVSGGDAVTTDTVEPIALSSLTSITPIRRLGNAAGNARKEESNINQFSSLVFDKAIVAKSLTRAVRRNDCQERMKTAILKSIDYIIQNRRELY